MLKIDAAVSPIADEIHKSLRNISRKLPVDGSTEYKRSPVRSMRSVLNFLEKAESLLYEIE